MPTVIMTMIKRDAHDIFASPDPASTVIFKTLAAMFITLAMAPMMTIIKVPMKRQKVASRGKTRYGHLVFGSTCFLNQEYTMSARKRINSAHEQPQAAA